MDVSLLRSSFSRLLSVTVVLLTVTIGRMGAQAAEPLQYNRDIRPILAEQCFACHGPDSAARKADLRLDKRDAAIAQGAIDLKDPSAGGVWTRIVSDDPDLVMPPPSSHKTLTAHQKQTLQRWLSEGAVYEPHWSFIAPKKAAIPTVTQQGWVRNPIDAFILAKLESQGLTPAPEADWTVLARRLSLDITGLPPTHDMVATFVNDTAPDAYERYVDRLLASDAYGEHRGRYWLDAARYADTHGIHFDNFREMWSYREWVINAFNRNQPFDQFTIEQLAGDLLPSATLDQKVASGFNRCNMTTNEGGTIPEEYLVLYTRDRTETTSLVFMGLTTGCAVCHDHKFDPLSQKEFYELAAFFNNTTQKAMDGNIKDTPPIVVVPPSDEIQRWNELAELVPRAKAGRDARRGVAQPAFDEWVKQARVESFARKIPQNGLLLQLAVDRPAPGQAEGIAPQIIVTPSGNNGEPQVTVLEVPKADIVPPAGRGAVTLDGKAVATLPDPGNFDTNQPFAFATWVKLAPNDSVGAIMSRMDDTHGYRGWDFWVQGRRVGMHFINDWPGNAFKVVSKPQIPGNVWTHVAVSYDGSAKAAGVTIWINGEQVPTQIEADALKGTTKTDVPWKLGQRNTGNPLSGAAIADLRLYDRSLNAGEVQSLSITARVVSFLAAGDAERTADEKKTVFEWWLTNEDAEWQKLTIAFQTLEREQTEIRSRSTVAYVMNEKPSPPMAFVLNRGEYDQRRDEVKPAIPAMLNPMDPALPRNRLGLAQWLVSSEHPLTARVTVNRLWQEIFGTGLVATSGDFGITGELPSHPELLDWLAVDFRENGWDVKRMIKQIVTSAAYRQAAVATPEKIEKDGANRLLSRGPRFRMDAEMLRDNALAVSGLLVHKIGGPSVKPYQPAGVWEVVGMPESNTRNYKQDHGESLYRRSLYSFWKRGAPPASLEIFNAPNRETCTVRRERTNTPLQALVTLNDPQFVEAARVLAERTLSTGDETASARLDRLGAAILGRPWRDEEKAVLMTSLEQLREHFIAQPAEADKLVAVGESPRLTQLPASEVATWTLLTSELMNLDEFLCK